MRPRVRRSLLRGDGRVRKCRREANDHFRAMLDLVAALKRSNVKCIDATPSSDPHHRAEVLVHSMEVLNRRGCKAQQILVNWRKASPLSKLSP
jgi:hypothetical protein